MPPIEPSARGSASGAANQGRSTQGVAAAKRRVASDAARARLTSLRGRPPPAGHEVSHDALVRLAWRPALRAAIVEDLALECVGLGRVPQPRQVVVDVAQAADLALVDGAREDVAPRVDEARGAERVAAHRRAAGLEVAADAREVGALEVPDRRARQPAQVRVPLD